jgi:hypothetical protein
VIVEKRYDRQVVGKFTDERKNHSARSPKMHNLDGHDSLHYRIVLLFISIQDGHSEWDFELYSFDALRPSFGKSIAKYTHSFPLMR